MRFFSGFLGWSLLLAVASARLGDGYRTFLARALETALAAFGQRVTLERVDTLAPMDLVLFAALTLPSDAWPWRRRLAALLAGLPALILFQIASWTAAIVLLMSAAARGTAPPAAEPFVGALMGTVGWLAPLVAWMAGPGPAMLERARGRSGPGASQRPRPSNRAG